MFSSTEEIMFVGGLNAEGSGLASASFRNGSLPIACSFITRAVGWHSFENDCDAAEQPPSYETEYMAIIGRCFCELLY